ncbi:MAG: hypothetical protein J5867_03865 [Prevotella sp.]|nr:hypothetical protein [Prevotella sp.]
MRKNYLRKIVMVATLLVSANAMAVEFPKIGRTLTDGATYTLVSYVKPDIFLARTSWDGAYYLLPLADSQYAKNVFTAHQVNDDTWYFSVAVDEETTNYVGIPIGTDNLNGNLGEPAYFTVTPGDVEGFYRIKAGEGNLNGYVIGRYLHLNAGGQYLIINEPTNSYYPDFYGGIQTEIGDDGMPYNVQDENGEFIPLDHSSENWAFADVADIPSYYNKIQLYTAIKDMEDNKLTDETYRQGFQGAIDAVTVYYNKEDLTDEDVAEALAIINAKNALYNEIQDAKALLEEGDDAALREAITTAIAQFNGQNDVEALKAAQAALFEAEKNYNLGQGDLTKLGKNMSFEDLSAQGGNTTTGVVNPPAGWNLYVNGTLVTSADEMRANGLNGWAGINGDGTGAKDGNMIFGIWNSGMPTIELSQTLEGLENGTYTVFASVMVGANGSGSRRTTQRIFGNLNSKYFAAEGDYDLDKLDKQEVFSFEGLSEPVTDTELQEMSVQAYVYDGTLTFGFRTDNNISAANRTTSNGAGGDGWFKIDNFRIYKEESSVETALGIYEYYKNMLSNLQGEPMQVAVEEYLNELIDGNAVSSSNTEQEIVSAFLALKGGYARVKSSVDAYAKLNDAISAAEENLREYSNYAGADEFGDIIMEAQDMYWDREADEAGIDEMIQMLDDGLTALKLSGVAVNIYVTDLIKNPSFEDMSAQGNAESGGASAPPAGWTLTLDGEVVTGVPAVGWCGINSGDGGMDQYGAYDEDGNLLTSQVVDGQRLWGIWNDRIPEVELSQTLTGLPAGTYVLSAYVMVEHQWAGNCLTTQRIFANNYVTMFGSEETHAVNLPFDALAAKVFDENNDTDIKFLNYAGYTCESGDPYTHFPRLMTLRFGVDESGIAKIGFRTNNIDPNGEARTSGIGWFKLDNFQLFYESEDIPTNVKGFEQAASQVKGNEYFTLDGRRVNAPQRGVNIVKMSSCDGSVKTVKVVVK